MAQHVEDGSAVLGAELLRNAGELSHALFPVLELLTWTGVLVFLALGLSLLEGLLDLLRPFVEDLLEVGDHVLVWNLGVLDVEGILGVGWVIWSKGDVASKGLDRLTYFFGEAVESLHELTLLLWLTGAPVGTVKLVNEWLVDIVNNGVKGENGMLIDLTEQNLSIVGSTHGNGLTWWSAPHEVHTLTLELELLT